MDGVVFHFWMLFIWVLLSAFFSASETAIYSLNRVRLRHRVWKGDAAAKRIGELLKDPGRILAMLLIANNITIYYATASLTHLLDVGGLFRQNPILLAFLATLLLSPLLLVFGELVPKSVGKARANSWVFGFEWLLRLLIWILYPAVSILDGISRAVRRLLGQTDGNREKLISRQMLRHYFGESHREGLVSEQQREMLGRIIGLGDLNLSRLAGSMEKAQTIRRDMSFDDVLAFLSASKYSRFPVHDGDPSNWVGVVDGFDLLKQSPEDFSLERALQPLVRLPLSTAIDDALVEMRRNRVAIAAVVNAGGNLRGIVTAKELVAVLVGEITY